MLILISLALVALIIALSIFINLRTVAAVKALSGDASEFFSLVDRPESDDFQQAVFDTDKFAQDYDFKPHQLLHFSLPKVTLEVATWHDKKNARSLILFFHNGKKEFDIISHFSDRTRLSTTNQADSHFLPLGDKRHIQNFTHLNLAHLMGEHLASEEYLKQRHDLAVGLDAEEAFNHIIEEFTQHMAEIQSKGFWQLRGAYWYLWRRNLRANTSVKTLHKLS
ncbi:MAG: hypothetical protein HRU20_05550 [Pseudomonadales bacterium]|nr:hypothetical protein [Pseudomonadales bacterium]